MKRKRKKNLSVYNAFLVLLVALSFTGLSYFKEVFKSVTLPTSKEPIVFYSTSSNELQSTFEDAILSAEKSIVLLIYSLTDHTILHALNQKSAAGIPVTIICDAKTSPYLERELETHVRLIRRFNKGIMHLKILLIDGSKAWVGSANMTGESLNMHGNLVLGVISEPLGEMIQEKAEKLEMHEYTPPTLHRIFNVGGENLEFWFLPDDRDASLRIKQLIREAKKTIRIAMFTWTRQDLAKEVIHAYERGVDVAVAIDQNCLKGSGAKVAEMLKSAGVPLYQNQGRGLLHYKFAYIDGSILENGSANWTKAAFSQNDDCFMIINPLNTMQREQMEKLWNEIIADAIPF